MALNTLNIGRLGLRMVTGCWSVHLTSIEHSTQIMGEVSSCLLPHSLSVILGHFHRGLMFFLKAAAYARALDNPLRLLRVADCFDECFDLVLGADVVRRPHLFNLKALGDDSKRVGLLAEREQCGDADLRAVVWVHLS